MILTSGAASESGTDTQPGVGTEITQEEEERRETGRVEGMFSVL